MNVEGGSTQQFGDSRHFPMGDLKDRLMAAGMMPDEKGPHIDQPESPVGDSVAPDPEISDDQNPSHEEMMTRFMTDAVGETTESENKAIEATKEELELHRAEAKEPEVEVSPEAEVQDLKDEKRTQVVEDAIKIIESGRVKPEKVQAVLASQGYLSVVDGHLVANDELSQRFMTAKVQANSKVENSETKQVNIDKVSSEDAAEDINPIGKDSEISEPADLPEVTEEVNSVQEQAEATEINPAEAVVDREILIEKRARENVTFNNLEARIAELEKSQPPVRKGFLSQAYLWVVKNEEFQKYRQGQAEYKAGQKSLEKARDARKAWLKKETEMFIEGEAVSNELSELLSKINSGEATKKDREKVEKVLAKLVNKRELINNIFAEDVATRIGIEHSSSEQSGWVGLTTLSEDFKKAEQAAKTELVNELKEDFTGENSVHRGPNSYQKVFEKLGIMKIDEEVGHFPPNAQKRFFSEEANGSLANLAGARAVTNEIETQIRQRLESGNISGSPLEMFQLYAALRSAKLEEKRAEAEVRNAVDRVSKSETLENLKKQTIANIKKKIGEKVFLVDSGLEIEAETKLAEIVLSGNSDLTDVIYKGWHSVNAVKMFGKKTAFGLTNLRRAYYSKFSQLIPESTNAAVKEAELTQSLAQIEAERDSVVEASNFITNLRNTSLERRAEIVREAEEEIRRMNEEQRQKVVDNIVEGMIDVLNIPAQSKARLRRLYDEHGLEDGFLDEVAAYYEKSKMNLSRKKKKAEEELREVSERREWLVSLLDRAGEGDVSVPLDEVGTELAEIDHLIDERILSIQDQMDVIARNYQTQIRSLEAEIEEGIYKKILENIS